MYFRKSTICSHKLDVHTKKRQCLKVLENRKFVLGCWFANGWWSCSRSLVCGDRSVTLLEKFEIINPRSSRKPLAKFQHQIEKKSNQDVDQLSDLDDVVTNANSAQCGKMRGTVLRIGKQEDRATVQGFQSSFGRSPNWKEELENKGELSEVCSLIVLKNACTSHELVDLTFCCLSINWHDLSRDGLKHVTDDWHD